MSGKPSAMDSLNLGKRGFSTWRPFEKEILRDAPIKGGVYIFRKLGGQSFGRLIGISNILYIGSSKRSLRQRLQQYFHPGPSQWTNKRIHEYAIKNSVEVSWLLCDEPKSFEHDLLREYLDEHGELPPLNASNIRKLTKNIEE